MSRLVEKIGEDRYRFNANYKRIWQKLMEYEEIGTVEEFKSIKQWKSDVMEDFCRYDVNSFDELVANARAKAIDEFAIFMSKYIDENQYGCVDDLLYRPYTTMLEIAEQMKAGGK